MTPKLVTGLAIAAVLCVGGAYLTYRANNIYVPRVGVGEKVLTGFAEQVNGVASIKVEKGLEKFLLVKKAGVWQVKDTGFPVSAVKVKQALLGLVGLSKLEAKTANPKKYLLIDVDSPGKKDGRGRQFTLSDKAGQKISQIVLGKTLTGKAGPGRDAQYVRLSSEKISWLVLGSVDATTALTSWVEPRFLKLDVDSVTYGRIEIDGEKVEVRRTGKSDSGSSLFELLDVPEGRKPRTSTTIKFVATDLVNLDLIDVRPKKAGGKVSSRAFVNLDGGMKLSFTMVEDGEKGWVSVNVEAKGSDDSAANVILAKTAGWEFLVSDTTRASFKKRKENLLQKPQ